MITLLLTLTKEIVEISNNGDFESGNIIIISDNGTQELGQILSIDDREIKSQDPEREIVILRLATDNDQQKIEHGQKVARELIPQAQKLTEELELPLYIWDATFSFDEKKVTFFFQAQERVDFRELVRSLATEFGRKVHLQQVGPRDRAKLKDGFGACGQRLCCANFLRTFPSVTMDTVRVQNLDYKSTDKISGQCGRLLCCLNYEVDAYREIGANFPALGETVKFAGGEQSGKVISNDVLSDKVKVQVNQEGHHFVIAVPRKEITNKYKTVAEVTTDWKKNAG